MYIKNKAKLLSNEIQSNSLKLRQIGLEALEKAISAVKPSILMEKSIKLYEKTLFINKDGFNLQNYNKIFIIGGGKAVGEMALSLERILGKIKNVDYKGIINIPEDQEKQITSENNRIKINFCSHPIPNEHGVDGTKSMVKLIEDSSKDDLIFCLLSGGGSALLPLPRENISIKDLQEINSLLLASGASIHEINIIRKHISGFKGGNLAKKLYEISKAKLVCLIISDVVGDDLTAIASGPTVPDTSTYKDAVNILESYNLMNKIPKSIQEHLEKGLKDKNFENPNPNHKCFTNVYNYLIGSVKIAINEVKSCLSANKFHVHYFSDHLTGEANEFGKTIPDIMSKYIENTQKFGEHKNLALLGTGELTVTIKGKGIGGRNQEMLLGFLKSIKNKDIIYDFLVIGANLDGIEGNSKAMGALVDNRILDLMVSKNYHLEKYILENDSNTFFKNLKCEIITGPTGCNVNDLLLILIST